MVATPVAARRAGGARIPQHPRLVARRRSGRCSSRSRARTGTCRGRSSCMSGGSRWKRISARSSTSICRGPRWWSAAARSLRRCSATIPACMFTGPRYGEALARAYAGGGRVRVPQPDRHVRPGDPGGAGLRHAGGGVSGDRAEGRAGGRGRQDRRGERRSARRGAGGAGRRPRGVPRACRAVFVAGVRRDVPVAPGADRRSAPDRPSFGRRGAGFRVVFRAGRRRDAPLRPPRLSAPLADHHDRRA